MKNIRMYNEKSKKIKYLRTNIREKCKDVKSAWDLIEREGPENHDLHYFSSILKAVKNIWRISKGDLKMMFAL